MDAQLEKIILSGFFSSETMSLEIRQSITSEHFEDNWLKQFYEIVCTLQDKGIPHSRELYYSKIENPIFDNIKDQLVKLKPSDEETLYAIKELKKEAMKTAILSLSGKARQYLQEGKEVEEVCNQIMDEILIKSSETKTTQYLSSSDLVCNVINDMNKGYEGFWKTGISMFDKEMYGLEKETLWTLCADASIGKTAFTLFIAKQIAKKYRDEVKVVYFSLEMTKAALGRRIVANEVEIPEYKLLNPKLLTEIEKERIQEITQSYLMDLPFSVSQEVRSVDALVNEIRSLCYKNRKRKMIFIIDNLGKISSTIKEENQKIDNITSRLADIKDTTGATIILLHHTNKLSSKKEDMYVPDHDDFRGSGKIKDNSDIMSFAVRPDYYIEVRQWCEDKYRETGEERYLIEGKFGMKYTKNRAGEVKQIWFNHQIEFGKFY